MLQVVKLVKFDLALISGKLHCLLFFAIEIVVCEQALKISWENAHYILTVSLLLYTGVSEALE